MNYLRQARKYMANRPQSLDRDVLLRTRAAEKFFAQAASAIKFVLPDGGRIFDDELKVLPDILRLPYREIVCEYKEICSGSKVIILAVENGDGTVYFEVCASIGNEWGFLPVGVVIESMERRQDGRVEKIKTTPISFFYGGVVDPSEVPRSIVRDVSICAQSILGLIEALSCTNVAHEAIPKTENRSSIKRGSLPFDEYRTLVIKTPSGTTGTGNSGDRAASREHLRRGHIRNHPSAGKIWVNACVVNAGAAGKVIKQYRVAA